MGLEAKQTGGKSRVSALVFSVAETLEQVEAAWELVHNAYTRIGLIDPNPWRIHTVAQAPGPDSLVVVGMYDDGVGATMTAIRDSHRGLPLDDVYPTAMRQRRDGGRQVVEFGLFADRRESFGRSLAAVFELMRYAFHFAMSGGADEITIGVHPHHVPFYVRCFGFEQFADERAHPTVKQHPVVPLVLTRQRAARAGELSSGAARILANPIAPAVFTRRYRFPSDQLASSRINRYLGDKAITIASPHANANAA